MKDYFLLQWVQDGSPSHSTPIRVESSNQFVPLGTSKKEFKKLQQAMKEGRRAGGITAGPESKVLEGPTWQETAPDGRPLSAADHIEYQVGAASKGIIQRDFQHHATVFKSAYAKNPFDNVSADELEEYRRIIDAKSRMDDRNNTFKLCFCFYLLHQKVFEAFKFHFQFLIIRETESMPLLLCLRSFTRMFL